MAKHRNVPAPRPGAFDQPIRMRFDILDRIIFAPPHDYDWVWDPASNDDGHIFRAAHNHKITRELSHDQMRAEAKKAGFRHDRHWYSPEAAKVRLRADVSEMNDLPFEERQLIMWKEDFILEFERLEEKYPKTVSRGDGPMVKVIRRIDRIIKARQSRTTDNGRRKRSGRLKMTFDPMGPKALREWMNMYVEADRDPLVLRSRTYKSGNREERLTDEQLALIRKYSSGYLSRNQPSINSIREKMKAEIELVLNPARKKKKLPPIKVPSWGRLKREIANIDEFEKVAGREGVDEAMRQFRAYGEGMPDVLRPLQQVEMDHWTVGLRTILSKVGVWSKLNRGYRRKLQKVRMILGVAICRRTDCILGMTLSLRPTVDSVIRLIEMVVSNKQRFADAAGCKTPYDIYGTPEMLFFDGGPAFNNGQVRAILRDLGIDWEITPGGLPHLRGKVERMFRTLDQKVVSLFEGRTFSNVVAKGDYNPDERAGTYVDEIGRVLVRHVVDRHHNTPRKTLGGETPRECYLNLAKKHGILPAPDSHKQRNVFGIDIKRVLGPGGIRFLNIQYRSRALHEHFLKVGRAEVVCRVHLPNLGAMSVRTGASLLTVPAPKEFHGVDAETWIAAEALIRKKMAKTVRTVTGPIINAAILEIERTAEIGRKRAQISDHPMARKALLAAEASMRIFANFPDDEDPAEAEPPVNVYETAIPVTTSVPAGRRARSANSRRTRVPGRRSAAARSRPASKPTKAAAKPTKATSKPSKPVSKAPRAASRPPRSPASGQTRTTPKTARKAAKAPKHSGFNRRPGLKRTFSARD